MPAAPRPAGRYDPTTPVSSSTEHAQSSRGAQPETAWHLTPSWRCLLPHGLGRHDPREATVPEGRKQCAPGSTPLHNKPRPHTTISSSHRAGSKLAATAPWLTDALSQWHRPGTTGGWGKVAFTHQTVGLCQSSEHWVNSLRSAAGALPTETKQGKPPLTAGHKHKERLSK